MIAAFVLVVAALGAEDTVPEAATPATIPPPGKASYLPPATLVREIRRATILRLSGKAAEGLAVLEEAVRNHPTEVAPLLAMLEYGRDAELGADAAARVRERIRERLADPHAVVDAATLRQALRSDDVPEADVRVLREAVIARLAGNADDSGMWEMLALLETRLDDLPAARVALEKAAAIRPAVHLEERLIAIDATLGRWEDVVARTRSLLERKPDDAARRMDLARALARLGRASEAAATAETLLENPGYRHEVARDVFIPLGWLYRDAGDDAAAERAFRKALELSPNQPVAKAAVAHYYSGETARLAARKSEDDRWAKESNPFELVREGAARIAAQDPSGALPLLRRATELAPDDPVAWYNRGLAAQKLDGWDEASQAYRRTTEIAPGMAEGWLGLGRTEHRNRRFIDAITHLERALSIRPDLRQAHALLSQCHAALGNAEAAETHRRRSASEAP